MLRRPQRHRRCCILHALALVVNAESPDLATQAGADIVGASVSVTDCAGGRKGVAAAQWEARGHKTT